ncbi:MAG: hypothetical protein QME65_05960 [Candidatus Omnitrophota bacterium]|nr:hypothetical protein [Candidatus Omnitrophota bacterium]
MRGITLPVNVIVILVLAVLVLVGVLGLYMSGWMGPAGGVSVEAAKIAACREFVSKGCVGSTADISVTNFDADNSGAYDAGDTLQALCANYYNAPGETACKDLCGCP